MGNKSISIILAMSLVLALCVVLQHVVIFSLGYELSSLQKDKQDLKEVVQRQELVVEELTSPAVLKQQQKRFDIQLSSSIGAPDSISIDAASEKVAIE